MSSDAQTCELLLLFNFVLTDWCGIAHVCIKAFIGFEADGMMTGYTGCEPTHMNYPHWRAAPGTPREELCPVDKYGFDARYDSLAAFFVHLFGFFHASNVSRKVLSL